MALEKLFEKYGEKTHCYTWDYEDREKAFELYDLDDERFALITLREDFTEDDLSGASRSQTYYVTHVYSKINPQRLYKDLQKSYKDKDSLSIIILGIPGSGEVYDHQIQKRKLLDKIKIGLAGANPRKVERLYLDCGEVYISEENLLLDRNSGPN
jgi:hypothetical protein